MKNQKMLIVNGGYVGNRGAEQQDPDLMNRLRQPIEVALQKSSSNAFVKTVTEINEDHTFQYESKNLTSGIVTKYKASWDNSSGQMVLDFSNQIQINHFEDILFNNDVVIPKEQEPIWSRERDLNENENALYPTGAFESERKFAGDDEDILMPNV
jgi:hypothetical protein